MLKYVFLFSSILLFLSACARPIIYDNKTIQDPQEKKKRFKQDSMFCEIEAYEKVPLVQTNYVPRRKRGDFTATDQYGNTYTGTYKDNSGGFAHGLAAGAAAAQQVHMDKLRNKVFEYCMNRKNWYRVTKEEVEAEKKFLKKIEEEAVKKQNEIDMLMDKVAQDSNKSQAYVCVISGIIKNDKLVEIKDKKFLFDNLKVVALTKINGKNALLDSHLGLFSELWIKNGEAYTNGILDYFIQNKTNSGFLMYSVVVDNVIKSAIKGTLQYKCQILSRDPKK